MGGSYNCRGPILKWGAKRRMLNVKEGRRKFGGLLGRQRGVK